MPTVTRAIRSATKRRQASRPRSSDAAKENAAPLKARDPNVITNALKPTKTSLGNASAGQTIKVNDAVKASSAGDKKSAKPAKPTRFDPPKMTASYVMGVQKAAQRHPSRKQPREKAAETPAAHAELMRVASTAESSATASLDAAAVAVEAVTEARQSAAKAASVAAAQERSVAERGHNGGRAGGKAGKGAKGPSKAMKAAARVAFTRATLAEATQAAARAADAKQQVAQYTEGWQASVGKSWSDETLPVGHKLKQLCKACGVSIPEDSFGPLFAKLGGVGSTVSWRLFTPWPLACRPCRSTA